MGVATGPEGKIVVPTIGSMSLDTTSLREEANDLLSPTVELRRTLHEWPEVGNELPVTRDHVLEAIEGLPLDVTRTRRRAASRRC